MQTQRGDCNKIWSVDGWKIIDGEGDVGIETDSFRPGQPEGWTGGGCWCHELEHVEATTGVTQGTMPLWPLMPAVEVYIF